MGLKTERFDLTHLMASLTVVAVFCSRLGRHPGLLPTDYKPMLDEDRCINNESEAGGGKVSRSKDVSDISDHYHAFQLQQVQQHRNNHSTSYSTYFRLIVLTTGIKTVLSHARYCHRSVSVSISLDHGCMEVKHALTDVQTRQLSCRTNSRYKIMLKRYYKAEPIDQTTRMRVERARVWLGLPMGKASGVMYL